jgi:hypothetical protein
MVVTRAGTPATGRAARPATGGTIGPWPRRRAGRTMAARHPRWTAGSGACRSSTGSSSGWSGRTSRSTLLASASWRLPRCSTPTASWTWSGSSGVSSGAWSGCRSFAGWSTTPRPSAACRSGWTTPASPSPTTSTPRPFIAPATRRPSSRRPSCWSVGCSTAHGPSGSCGSSPGCRAAASGWSSRFTTRSPTVWPQWRWSAPYWTWTPTPPTRPPSLGAPSRRRPPGRSWPTAPGAGHRLPPPSSGTPSGWRGRRAPTPPARPTSSARPGRRLPAPRSTGSPGGDASSVPCTSTWRRPGPSRTRTVPP